MPSPTLQGNTIWCIVHKETGKFCSFGSKVAWLKEGYAKAAYNTHVGKNRYWQCKDFIDLEDENCLYEIIEINN